MNDYRQETLDNYSHTYGQFRDRNAKFWTVKQKALHLWNLNQDLLAVSQQCYSLCHPQDRGMTTNKMQTVHVTESRDFNSTLNEQLYI